MGEASGKPDQDTLRMNRLREAFAAAAVVEIVGVVGASGASGAHTPPESLWTLLFNFSVWRIAGEPTRNTPLTIRQEVLHDELQRLMGLFPPYKVIRIRARLVERLEDWKAQAYMESIVGEEPSDAEMNSVALKLQEPVTYEDAQFGTLILDRRLDRYEGEATWDGQPADGSFDFWHNDGDLFWGHAIQISGSLSEGPKSADIPG